MLAAICPYCARGSDMAPGSTAQDPPNNSYTRVYEVKEGDTLAGIAEQYYGDPSLYPRIFEANLDSLVDPNKIRPGQKLRIP
jgi:nucleoid-associated protein YgaU